MNTFTISITISRDLYKEFMLASQTGFKPWQKNFYLLPVLVCVLLGIYSLLLAPKGSLMADVQTTTILLTTAVLLSARNKIATYRAGRQYDADSKIGAAHQYIVSEDSITVNGSGFTATYPRSEVTNVVSSNHFIAVVANKKTIILFPTEQLTAEQQTFITHTFTPTK